LENSKSEIGAMNTVREKTETAVRCLADGQVAVLDSLHPSPSRAKRLADMGFIKGARLQMIRGGNPCILRVESTRIGLGRTYQADLEVRLEPTSATPGNSGGTPLQDATNR
jgi:Fe2+ transport system protein FeoA